MVGGDLNMWIVTVCNELGRTERVVCFATEEEAVEEYLRLRHELGAQIVEEDYIGFKAAPGEHFTTLTGQTVALGEIEI
jgi:uncharacterized protein YbcI